MSTSPGERRELLELLHALREEQASAEQRQRLNALVNADSNTRQLYIDHMVLAAALRWSNLSFNPAHLGVPPHCGDAATSRQVELLLPHDGLFDARRSLRSLMLTILAVAAVFYGVFVGLAWNLRSNGGRHQNEVATGEVRLPAAKLTDVKNCRWEGTASAPIVGDPLPSGELTLAAGLAELTFSDGAKVILEGPARFEPRGLGLIHLQIGKLTANVPPEATRFTVTTPSATVVDLGTEFGVEVTDDRATITHVFLGMVEVSAAQDDAAPGVVTSPQRIKVRANESLKITAAGDTEVNAESTNTKRFIRSLTKPETSSAVAAPPPDKAYERWRVYSEKLRQDEGLVAYYSFDDQPHDDVLRNQALRNPEAARFHGTINGKAELRWQRGRFANKAALKFNGLGDKVQFNEGADKFGLNDSFTVAAWIWPIYTDLTDLAIIGGKSSYIDNRSLHFVLRKGSILREGLAPQQASLLRPEEYYPYLGFWQSDAVSTRPVAPGQWTLVVFRYDRELAGGTQSVFVNNQNVTEGSANGRSPFAGTEPLQLGSAFDDGNRLFCGLMDEVAFFRRALSAKEINEMHQAGQSQ